ncbi:MAG: hypothetical protein KC466_17490 [Myxococcales bacterium]|nr:hypothetical protein [Myxococcales bacterium]
MHLDRFRQIALLAALGLTAGCAAPDWPPVSRSVTAPAVLSGVTTPGQAYLRELTIGAADGMRVAGWRDREVQARVERARDAADLFRFDMGPEARAAYDGVREAGYAQGLSGAWDQAALEGYLDVVEASGQRFIAITGVGHSAYGWSTPLEVIAGVTGATDQPFGPDRFGHEVTGTALASEINEISLHIAEVSGGVVAVPTVMAGDMMTRGREGPADLLRAYAEVLPVRPVEGADAPSP